MYISIKSPIGAELCTVKRDTSCVTVGQLLEKLSKELRANGTYLKPEFWKGEVGLDPNTAIPEHLNVYILCALKSNTLLRAFDYGTEIERKQAEMIWIIVQCTFVFILTGVLFGFVFQ